MSKSRELLILQATGEELRAAVIRRSGGDVEIVDARPFPCGDKNADISPFQDETAVAAFVDYVKQRRLTGCDVVCMLGGSQVACQYYELPPLKGALLRQAVLLKLGQQLHFPVGQAVVAVDPAEAVVVSAATQIRVRATAVHQDLARAAIDVAGRAGLRLLGVSASLLAHAALAADRANTNDGVRATLHVDERGSTLAVLSGVKPIVCTEVAIALSDLTAGLMRPILAGEKVIQLEAAQALALRNQIGIPSPRQSIESLDVAGDKVLPLLEPALQKYAKHLTQWLTFASTCAGAGVVGTLTLVGPGAALPGLAEALATRLSIQVEPASWMGDLGIACSADAGVPLEALAAAVGAALHLTDIPDLLPPDVRRERSVRRIRRAVTTCAPVAAGALAVVALLLGGIGRGLDPVVKDRERRLAEMQQVAASNAHWGVERETVKRLDSQLSGFSSETPFWIGVFKELSLLLPDELQATEYAVDGIEGGFRMRVSGAVVTKPEARGFDEVVEQTLLVLGRSPFFKHVELVSANRGEHPENPRATGLLSVQFDLVYSQPQTRS